MAGRAALGRALVASGGTILAIGGATMLVSTVSMGVARAVVMEKKVQLECRAGGGQGGGEGALGQVLHTAAQSCGGVEPPSARGDRAAVAKAAASLIPAGDRPTYGPAEEPGREL